MSGNGEKKAHPGIPLGLVTIPAADGGGCIMDGPFKE